MARHESDVFDPESFSELFNSDWLLKMYHIHWVRDVDAALTAMKENDFDYDYFLLDVALCDAFGEIEDFSEIPEDNKATLRDFVFRDGWKKPSFASESDEEFDSIVAFYKDKTWLNAGMHLYLYLIHTNNVNADKIRVYSGHIEHVKSFKGKLEDKGIPPIAHDYIFTKATDGELKVKEWLRKTVTNPERLLRHAMIEGCDEALKEETVFRTIYPRSGGKAIEPDVLKQHISTIRDVVKALGAKFESDPVKKGFYLSLLILLITSECQEQASYHKNNTYELKQLMGVLDRIRNMDYNFGIYPVKMRVWRANNGIRKEPISVVWRCMF